MPQISDKRVRIQNFRPVEAGKRVTKNGNAVLRRDTKRRDGFGEASRRSGV